MLYHFSVVKTLQPRMSLPATEQKRLFAHLASDSPEVLAELKDPAVNLVVWRRQAQPCVTRELASAQPIVRSDRRNDTTPATFRLDVAEYLSSLNLDPSAFEHLMTDLERVARQFFAVANASAYKFRLLFTGKDDCRRFHVDNRRLRLLCTYRGPGTQWLRNDQVDRAALNRGDPNDEILRHGAPQQLQAFWVAIMRGQSVGLDGGLVHRSPPIAGTGETRVVFCLDAEPAEAE